MSGYNPGNYYTKARPDAADVVQILTPAGPVLVPASSMGGRQAPYQAVAYAASLTIDPTAGAVVQVGALTGNITIAAPASPVAGDVLLMNFVQDSTGGWVVTWDAAFDADAVLTQPIDVGASKRSSAGFVYSGGVWQ